jgi:DNA-binding CsgD family transcriptional regulator
MTNPMDINPQSDGLHNAFIKCLEKIYENPIGNIKKKELPEKHKFLLEDFANNEQSIKILLNQGNAGISYISDNVEKILGYKAEDFLKLNILLLFRILTLEHMRFPITMASWSKEIFSKLSPEQWQSNLRATYCGMKIRRKDKGIIRLLIRYTPLDFDSNNVAIVSIATIENVTHLLDSDFYWGRIVCGKESTLKKYHYNSSVGKNQEQDIITEREKEVLNLIADGRKSREIAEELFISTVTVDNHRKNMLVRTGARDTTALVQLSRMCGII